MFNVTSLRYRYTQFFVLLLLCSFTYMMVRSAGAGIKNFQDNFYQKEILMEKATLLRIKIGDRVFPLSLLGKDGWMEYLGDGNLDDFQNANGLEHKKNLASEIANLNEYLKSQDITLLIVVAPNKASIYPDKLPEQITPLSTQSRLDSFISYLQNNNLPVTVDLRPALRDARQNQDVYYKTNTHWNGYGALVAYTTIIYSLQNSYPDLKPYDTADLKLVTAGPYTFDIPMVMHANFIKEQGLFYKPKEPFVQTIYPGDSYGYDQFSSIQDSKLPKLLMFHDSFGFIYLNDYLSMNFGESHFIHNNSIKKYLTQETIQQFNPDIVIIETVERNLDGLLSQLSNFASK